MKLFGSNPWRGYGISRVLRAVFFSAKSRPSSSPQKDSLYQKVVLGRRDPKTPITPDLDRWLQEGRKVNRSEPVGLIKQLRKYKRYSHALQVKEWMTDKLNIDLTAGGKAGKLDLICRVHGLNKAEEYFNSIPVSSRVERIYVAMLNCYAVKESLQKAEDIFKKMKELGFAKSALTYNIMLTIYSRMGIQEKLNSMVQEMENNGVKFDTYSRNIQLSAYSNSNIEAMESFLTKMEGDSEVKVDFHGYSVAAKGYLKYGLSEKALTVLKKAEELLKSDESCSDYEPLFSLYAAAGKKEEVYRIWDVYKTTGKASNSGYLSVLSSLLKLEDIDGAEKIFEEWECGTASFNSWIVNMFISCYCKKGLLDKALACADLYTDKGYKLDVGIWQCLATQCCVDGQMAKAVELLRKLLLLTGQRWRLNKSTLAVCIEYLKREGNVDAAHEIVGLLRKFGSFSGDVCDRLADFVNSDQEYGALAAIGV